MDAGVVDDRVLLDVCREVALVGVLTLKGIEDRVLRAQPEGGGHLAELQVEIDDADLLAHPLVEEPREVGGIEGLAAPTGRRSDRVHDAGAVLLGRWFVGSDRGDRRLLLHDGGGRRFGHQGRSPFERLDEVGVLDRQLEQVDGAGAHDVAQRGVGPAGERQHDPHLRELLGDDPQPGEARTGAEARAGDEEVEGTLLLEHLADGADARARRDLRGFRELVGEPADLFGEAVASVEYEDLRHSAVPSVERRGIRTGGRRCRR